MTKLTDAQIATLTRGAQHIGGFISPAPKTPAPMAHQQAKKLQALGLAQSQPCFHDEPWYECHEESGERFGYRLTAEGFDVLGIDESERPAYCQRDPDAPVNPQESELAADQPLVSAADLAASIAATEAPTQSAAKASLRDAAEAFLAAWDAAGPWRPGPVGRAVEGLRTALAKPARAERTPRGDTKQEQVIAMLKRQEGATNPEIQEATEWAPHTVRGFFAGLKKKGFTILAGKNPETKQTVYRIPG